MKEGTRRPWELRARDIHDVRALDCRIDSAEDEDARPKPQNNLTAEKHWENAKAKPILFPIVHEEIPRA